MISELDSCTVDPLYLHVQLDVIRVTYDLIKKYFPNKPVYSTIGNHDTSPVNRYCTIATP